MRQSRSNITKDFLINQYKLGKEIRQIAKELNCSTATIVLKNKDFGISAIDYNPKYKYKDEKWLREQFELYGNVSNVAKETGFPRTCISRYAEKYNIRKTKYHRDKNIKVDENYFKIIDTEEKAYFLGFIMADGCMYENSDGRFRFSIKLKSTDSDIIYKFADCIQFDKNKIIFRESKRKDTITKSVEIVINNQLFCKNLLEKGIKPKKSGKELIPKDIPNSLKKDFIRGFTDGDGSLTLTDNRFLINICSSCNDILLDIKEIIYNQIGVIINDYHFKTGMHVLQSANKKVVYLICNYLYKDSKVYLNRKFNIAMDIIAKYLY